jgi:hypothetical protein
MTLSFEYTGVAARVARSLRALKSTITASGHGRSHGDNGGQAGRADFVVGG